MAAPMTLAQYTTNRTRLNRSVALRVQILHAMLLRYPNEGAQA
jgi:hypothetical protein